MFASNLHTKSASNAFKVFTDKLPFAEVACWTRTGGGDAKNMSGLWAGVVTRERSVRFPIYQAPQPTPAKHTVETHVKPLTARFLEAHGKLKQNGTTSHTTKAKVMG
jgi:hypothetical protein